MNQGCFQYIVQYFSRIFVWLLCLLSVVKASAQDSHSYIGFVSTEGHSHDINMSWEAFWGYTFLISAVFGALMFCQRHCLRKKEQERLAMSQRFASLELKALQAQMNPHFIFNALNAIQSFIFDGDELMANDYLTRFSKLMRLYIDSSKSKYIAIGQEVKLLTLYVELEVLRFGNRLDFKVCAPKKLLNEHYFIPGMLIQPYVERAINQNLAYKKGQGCLRLEFFFTENQLICMVEDDGVGGQGAQESMDKGTSTKTIQAVDERLAVLHAIDDVAINITVEDKKDKQGHVLGTKVMFDFPLIHTAKDDILLADKH